MDDELVKQWVVDSDDEIKITLKRRTKFELAMLVDLLKIDAPGSIDEFIAILCDAICRGSIRFSEDHLKILREAYIGQAILESYKRLKQRPCRENDWTSVSLSYEECEFCGQKTVHTHRCQSPGLYSDIADENLHPDDIIDRINNETPTLRRCVKCGAEEKNL